VKINPLTLAFAAVAVTTAASDATVFTHVAGQVDWTAAATWSPGGGPPAAGDAANGTNAAVFTTFNGGVVGSANSGFTFNGSGAFTIDNLGSTATFTGVASGSSWGFGTTAGHDVDVTLVGDASFDFGGGGGTRTFTLIGGGSFTGAGTVTMSRVGLSTMTIANASTFSVGTLDASGMNAINVNFAGSSIGGTDLIMLGSATKNTRLFAGNANTYNTAFSGSSWNMFQSYDLFANATATGSITLDQWIVGGTQVAIGTYDINSLTQGNANFATIFATAGNDITITVTAVPEPGAVAMLSLAGFGLLAQRRRSARN
jgi:hypothetical protein